MYPRTQEQQEEPRPRWERRRLEQHHQNRIHPREQAQAIQQTVRPTRDHDAVQLVHNNRLDLQQQRDQAGDSTHTRSRLSPSRQSLVAPTGHAEPGAERGALAHGHHALADLAGPVGCVSFHEEFTIVQNEEGKTYQSRTASRKPGVPTPHLESLKKCGQAKLLWAR